MVIVRVVPSISSGEVVLFLASDAASFLTGIDLAADGGFSELGTYGAVWKHLHAAA